MILEIHSKFGVLVCEPMKLQAIENSIPESELSAEEQELQAAPDDGAQVIEAPIESSKSETSD